MCQGLTKSGKPCKIKSSNGQNCRYHPKGDVSTGKAKPKTKSANFKEITYPWASNFLEWLLPELKARGIPYKNPNTDGDYYTPTIGKKKIIMDWKHLYGQIEMVSDGMKPYGYVLNYKEIESGYLVKIDKV